MLNFARAPRRSRKPKKDVHQEITESIIAQIKAGTPPWRQPWVSSGTASRPLRDTGDPYSGINVVTLWGAAKARGFSSPYWMTFNQARQHGGMVRKGEKSTIVVRVSEGRRRPGAGDEDVDTEETVKFVTRYPVFNADQIENLPARYRIVPEATAAKSFSPIHAAEQFIARTGATIVHGGDDAAYDVRNDQILIPEKNRFRDVESYYATITHELTHWTRHPSRLDRDFGYKRYGDRGYAMEELVAEIASAFLAADLGITPVVREDHAAYIEAWLSVLNDDNKAIFVAASHADRAVEYLEMLTTREQQLIEEEKESIVIADEKEAVIEAPAVETTPVQGELAFVRGLKRNAKYPTGKEFAPGDRVIWFEPGWDAGNGFRGPNGKVVIEGDVQNVHITPDAADDRLRIKVLFAHGPGSPEKGSTIKRTSGYMEKRKSRRTPWPDENERAGLLDEIARAREEVRARALAESADRSLSM